MCLPNINVHLQLILGTAVAQWQRCCATHRKVGGSSTRFQQRIKDMSKNTTSSVHINGHISGLIPIRCSVRQGCPLGMQPLAVCLNPLLCTVEATLTDIQIGRRIIKTAVIAYAHDVTIFVTSPRDIPKIQTAMDHYEAASGARINTKKSKAMAIGSWDTSTDTMGIPCHTEMKIIGIHFTNTVSQSANNRWITMTGRIREQALDAYYRDLCLDKRILYIHKFLLVKAWYTAQIFPMPEDCKRQVNTAVAWYLWRGDIFRVHCLLSNDGNCKVNGTAYMSPLKAVPYCTTA